MANQYLLSALHTGHDSTDPPGAPRAHRRPPPHCRMKRWCATALRDTARAAQNPDQHVGSAASESVAGHPGLRGQLRRDAEVPPQSAGGRKPSRELRRRDTARAIGREFVRCEPVCLPQTRLCLNDPPRHGCCGIHTRLIGRRHSPRQTSGPKAGDGAPGTHSDPCPYSHNNSSPTPSRSGAPCVPTCTAKVIRARQVWQRRC